ncbi:MAG: acetyl-CoA carboxylase carboxyl transferase subunit beta [Chloroflexi bacterium]|nr:acetyl-CoA carboxylase carboxyl transferase subunit beta [Chloroflexota bacterium]
MVRNLTDLLSSVVRIGRSEEQVVTTRDTCLVCDADLAGSELYAQHRTCPVCRFHYSMTARERIESLADPESFKETNRSLISLDPLSFSSRGSYKQRIFRDQRRTGLTEAIVTGACTIGGSPVMLIVLDFGFMGGTMGCVVGEKVALALEQAVKQKLPAIAVVTSGGARIQEGVLSLMQMAKTSVAQGKLGEKGLPFISVLANPATGQVFASFANLADIILAEPGAIVGLSPMRLIEESSDQPLPRGSHTAESHLQHGMIDAVVDRTQLRDLLGVLLDLLGPQYRLTPRQKGQKRQVEAQRPEAWSSVQLARHESRPSSRDYIDRIFNSFVELHGDRSFGDDKAIVSGLGHLGGQTVMVVGQQRGSGSSGRTSPEGFRKAQRVFRLASKFDLPLITLIDTPGPNLSLDAEERGLGNTIASAMAEMAGLQVPSISVVIGEGGSSGALALGVADRVLMMEHAIYSAISPEDAAGLIFQDEARADEAAESLRLTARDCLELGIVDIVVPEPPGGAHNNPDEAARQVRRMLLQVLAELQSTSKRRLLSNRYKKFRKMGEYSSHFRAAVTREVNALRGLVATGVRRIARRGRQEPEEWPEGLLAEAEASTKPSGNEPGSSPG